MSRLAEQSINFPRDESHFATNLLRASVVNDRTDDANRQDASTAQPAGLRARLRYGYATGNFGKSLQNSTYDLFFLFYLVDYLGAPPAMAGGLLFAVAVADCIADLVVGHVIDQLGRSGPGYRRLIIFGVLASATAFVAMFLWPVFAPGRAVSIAIACLLAFRLGSTMVDVPHNALLAALSPDSRERGRLSTLRFLFSSAGNLAVSGLIALTLADQQHSAAGLARYVGVVTALYLAVMIACVRSIGDVRSNASPQTASPGSLILALATLGRNPRLVRVMTLSVLAASLITVFSRMTLFFAQSFLANASLASALVSAQILGQLISLPLWGWLQERLEKRTVALLAQAGFAVTMIAFLCISPSAPAVASSLFFLAGMGLSGLTVLNWAILPDTIEYTERAVGVRHEALTFGLYVTLTKISSGAGAGLIGLCLKASGYAPPEAGAGTQAHGLLLSMTGLPIVGAAAGIVILAGLRLSHRSHAGLADLA
jgi:GPH family glycoside/pentoside/hexuronide:cation symporter